MPAAAQAQELTVYSSLPRQGASRVQAIPIEQGAKLALKHLRDGASEERVAHGAAAALSVVQMRLARSGAVFDEPIAMIVLAAEINPPHPQVVVQRTVAEHLDV